MINIEELKPLNPDEIILCTLWKNNLNTKITYSNV